MAEERLAVRDERGGALNAEPRGLHTVRVWNIASRHDFPILSGHSGTPRHVALSPDGSALATGFDPSGEDFESIAAAVGAGGGTGGFSLNAIDRRSMLPRISVAMARILNFVASPPNVINYRNMLLLISNIIECILDFNYISWIAAWRSEVLGSHRRIEHVPKASLAGSVRGSPGQLPG